MTANRLAWIVPAFVQLVRGLPLWVSGLAVLWCCLLAPYALLADGLRGLAWCGMVAGAYAALWLLCRWWRMR